MELYFELPTGKTIIFTLHDAFPIAWSIGPLETGGSDPLVELVTITFSSVAFQSKNS